MTFQELHQRDTLFLLANVWDASSAKAATQVGFDAIGTSSAAMASVFGYDDGEQMPFDTFILMIARIRQVTDLPLSVDIEAGYSRDISQILAHVEQLVELGVVGINIEDSIVTTERRLSQVSEFASIVQAIKQRFAETLFVNVRTDTYLLAVDNVLAETLARIHAYENAGADGIFIPCLTNHQAISQVCSEATRPINVMAMPDLADFATLSALGVKRVSMGNFVFQALQNDFTRHLGTIKAQQTFSCLFS